MNSAALPTVTPETKAFSFYGNKSEKKPQKVMNLIELVAMAKDPRVGKKDNAPLITPFMADGKTKTLALSASFYALVIDHDDDDLTREQISERYVNYGFGYLAFTSSSHRQEKNGTTANRWKVILPLSTPISFERYTMIAIGIALMHSTDLVQARITQGFFAPNKITVDADYDVIHKTDSAFFDPFDDDNALLREAIDAFHQHAEEQKHSVSKNATLIPRDVETGQSKSIIEKTLDHYDLCEVLELHGYVKIGSKYLSPESSTGMPGIVILDKNGKKRCYSHHGESDPLSNLNNDGHSLDVFDVIRILEYNRSARDAVAALAPIVDPEGQVQREKHQIKPNYLGFFEEPEVDEKKEKRPLLIRLADLCSNPTLVEWTIRDIMEHQTLALIFGESGAGKSYVVLDMAFCVASGTSWHGHTVKKGPVVYVAGEGHAGVKRRLLALVEQHFANIDEIELYVSRKSVALSDQTSVGALVNEINSIPEKPVLVVIDTLARATAGLDENSARDMGEFIQVCDLIKDQYQCTVLLVHHTGLADKQRARGSSAIKAALDVEISIRQQDGLVIMSPTKMKDATPFGDMAFEFVQTSLSWEDEDGVPQKSAVLQLATPTHSTARKPTLLKGANRVAMEALEWCLKYDPRRPPDSLIAAAEFIPPDAVVAEDVWRKRCYSTGISDGEEGAKKKAFIRARSALMDMGKVHTFEGHYYTSVVVQ